jgi:hypothetical protein
MMKAVNKDGADAPLRVILEINPRHASAGLLDDATEIVARLNNPDDSGTLISANRR